MALALWLFAVVTAWRSAAHVDPRQPPLDPRLAHPRRHRGTISIRLPFGAAYIAIRHFPTRA